MKKDSNYTVETEAKAVEDTKDFSTSTIESNFETSFFYTNDKFINQIDNYEIFQYI